MEMICPKYKECDYACNLKAPHPKTDGCKNGCNYNDKKPCIPWVRELEKGDRVRVLPSATKEKYCTPKRPGWAPGKDDIVGTEQTIDDVHEHWCSAGGYAWHREDLELITEGDDIPDKPKYKWTRKSISASILYRENTDDCKELMIHFADLIHTLRPTGLASDLDLDQLLEWAEQDPRRIKWLIEESYIEEVRSNYDKWVDECPKINTYPKGHMTTEFINWAKRMPRD